MTHRVGAKGQVVIPKELRDELGIHPGTEVVFLPDGGGVRVVPVQRALDELRGMFAGSDMAERLLEDRRREPR